MLQPPQKINVVLGAHRLTPQIFVDRRHVARILPLRHQIGPVAMVPGEVIGREINENEHRAVLVLFGDHSRCGIKEETVRFDLARTEIVLVVETLHAGGSLETARAHERAERWIEREGAITAASQRGRQAAIDAAGRDSDDEIGKTAEAAGRQSLEHVVFSVPARAAIALDQEVALLAVERLEMRTVAARHFDAWRHANVETRLVVNEDDVRRLGCRRTRVLDRAQTIFGEYG